MDPDRQGGDPNRRGAYYNPEQRHDHPSSPSRRWPPSRRGPYDNPEQRHDLPSSSSQRWPPNRRGPYDNPEQRHDYPSSSSSRRPRLPEGCPLVLTTWPGNRQPLEGGYNNMNQRSTDVVGIPPDGNIWATSYRDSDSRPPMQNVTGVQDQYQRHSGSAAVFPAPGHSPVNPPGAAAYAQQGGSGAVFDAPGHGSNPNASSVYQPRAASLYANDSSARGGNDNTNPYASAAGRIPPPAITLQQPGAAVPRRSSEAKTLLALVQRARTESDFKAIIDMVVSQQQNNGVSLMEVTEDWNGEYAVMELAKSASLLLGPEELQRLFRCLVDGWIMEQKNGLFLLRYFFGTFGSVQCSIFTQRLALDRFWEMATSSVGYQGVMTCLEHAGLTNEGAILEGCIQVRAVDIAKTFYGSMLLGSIFYRGFTDLMDRIVEKVADRVIELSMDLHGNGVVRTCFLPRPPSAPRLRRGIGAFMHLRDDELRELAQHHRARSVLREMLRARVNCAVTTEAAMHLAERILRVGARNAGTWSQDGYAQLHHLPAGDPREQAIAFMEAP